MGSVFRALLRPLSASAPPSSRYRADLDGLRAVAVLAVVLFHAKIAPFTGGYVGVDVFFVISGYLIAGQLADRAARGELALGDFALRRARRLAPASLFVVAATLILFAPFLTPDLYRGLSISALAQTFFVANLNFWALSDYFGPAAEEQPLLHTWSLSLEVQMYALYAIVAVSCMRLRLSRMSMIAALALITVASFAASAVVTPVDRATAFYLPPTRFGEFTLGALIALVGPLSLGAAVTSALSAIGLAALAVAFLVLDETTRFPGYAVLWPTIAAAAVVWAGSVGRVGQALGWAPAAFVGRISYALYLWHWPVFLFADAMGAFSSLGDKAIVIAVSGILAALTYYFVEEPLRRRRLLAAPRRFLLGSGVAAAVSSALALLVVVTDGAPQRFADRIAFANTIPRQDECFDDDSTDGLRTCRFGRLDEPPRILAYGDSHVLSLLPVFDKLGWEHGVSGLFMGTSGCPPFDGVVPVRDLASQRRCAALKDKAHSLLETTPGLETVIIVGRWSYYVADDPVSGYRQKLVGPDGEALSLEDSRQAMTRALHETVARLTARGLEVVVVKQPPHHPKTPREAASAARLSGRPLKEFALSYAAHVELQQAFEAELDQNDGVRSVELAPLLCEPEGLCAQFEGDQALYIDRDHLSPIGATRVAPAFESIFRSLGERAGG